MTPSGTTNRGEGEGGWGGVQLGGRGLLEGAQLAARVLAAVKHTAWTWHTHTRANERVGNERQPVLMWLVAVYRQCTSECPRLMWPVDVTRGSRGLPQHGADDRPGHQTSEAQVQPEEASSDSCSHKTHQSLVSVISKVLACVKNISHQVNWADSLTPRTSVANAESIRVFVQHMSEVSLLCSHLRLYLDSWETWRNTIEMGNYMQQRPSATCGDTVVGGPKSALTRKENI